MYSKTEQEKEFLEKQNPPKTLKELKELTDRELLERQAFYLMKIEQSNNSIKNNVQFWFYFTIIALALSILILASK